MWWKKYTAVFNVSFKESLAYRFDAFSGAAFSIVKVVMAYILWRAVFGDRETVGAYTFPMMLTYYIFITFLTRIARSESVIWETAEDVRTGAYTKFITRPLNHFRYCFARSFSKGSFALIIDLFALALWMAVFRKYLYLPDNPMQVAYAALFAALGLFTMMQLHYLIALISFRTVDIAGPYFLVNNFIDFLSGSFIPLILLPAAVQRVLAFTPFYYILYYPASLFLGESPERIGEALAVVLLWNLGFALIRGPVYRRMLCLYEGVGA